MDPVFTNPHPYRKAKIPKALREQVWITRMGRHFEGKCKVQWCTNIINVFDFQCGHNIPESKGGKTNVENLVPICGRCNISMGSQFSIDTWNSRFSSLALTRWQRFKNLFRLKI